MEEHAGEFTHYVQNTLEHAATLTASDFSRALLRVDQLKRQMEEFFDHYDLLLSPTMAVPAFPIGERPSVIGGKEVNPFWGYLPFTFPINMTGQTASSVPCGFSGSGLPIGLHIVGPGAPRRWCCGRPPPSRKPGPGPTTARRSRDPGKASSAGIYPHSRQLGPAGKAGPFVFLPEKPLFPIITTSHIPMDNTMFNSLVC